MQEAGSCGWLATGVFLELSDISVSTASNDSVYDLVIAIAAGDIGP
ncbi:MAG: hypothetical protein OXI96_01345 [Acidimicrobiaceae bacterium]|nr:hypothetical protein [Acidimicrobiaceae bacterium]